MKGVGVMAKAPCRDCTKRHLGCHDSCEEYQATKPKYNQNGRFKNGNPSRVKTMYCKG